MPVSNPSHPPDIHVPNILAAGFPRDCLRGLNDLDQIFDTIEVSLWYEMLFNMRSKADESRPNLARGVVFQVEESAHHHQLSVTGLYVRRSAFTSAFRVFTARCYASAVLAMGLCPSVSVCLCLYVCLSQAGVLLKRQNIGSHKQHHTIPQGL